MLCCDASRIRCTSIVTWVVVSPSEQTNFSWPGGGSGHTHQRASSRHPLTDLPRGKRNGWLGSSSYLGSIWSPGNVGRPPANSTPSLKGSSARKKPDGL